jgi:predicted Zn-dependent peptidase
MNEDFRKSPPEALPLVPFNIPTPTRFKLSNGLSVVTVEDRRFPTISLRLGFRFGDINDPDGQVGVNSAMASLLSEGTENYTSSELAAKIDSIGASIGAGSGFDNTILRASCLSTQFDETSALMSEILLRPVFPENELDLYKRNAIEGLKYQRSQPDFLSDQQVSRIIFGEHPYAVNSPTEEDFEKLSREGLLSAFSKGLVPNNAVLVAVGDISAETLRERLESEFAGWESGEIAEASFPDPPERNRKTLTVVDRPGSTQANIVLTNLAIERTNPDYFPLLLMNQVLGAGASSRLFMNLREEKGYTYGAYSRLYARRLTGSFEATSEVRTAVTGESLKEFFFELNRIRDEKVGDEELDDAKNFLAGVFPIRAETQGGLIGLLVAQELGGLPDDYLETYREKIRGVTGDEIKRVANLYVQPDRLAIVIVGDADEVIKQAADYADHVEVFDAMGAKLDVQAYLNVGETPLADLGGKWNLLIDAQGQEMPVTVNLIQEGDVLSGEMESMLGNGTIRSGNVEGNRFTATVSSEFQGQEIELSLKGKIDSDALTGTISIPIMPEPLNFKGTKE